jgi:hypothetical protein
MTDAVAYRRTDLMGGQDEPSDLIERAGGLGGPVAGVAEHPAHVHDHLRVD